MRASLMSRPPNPLALPKVLWDLLLSRSLLRIHFSQKNAALLTSVPGMQRGRSGDLRVNALSNKASGSCKLKGRGEEELRVLEMGQVAGNNHFQGVRMEEVWRRSPSLPPSLSDSQPTVP